MSTNFAEFSWLRVSACAPALVLGDPETNARAAITALGEAAAGGSHLLLLPELALTGFSSEDLFASTKLLDGNREALAQVVAATRDVPVTVVVGAPLELADGRLLNCAMVCGRGRLHAAVPKQHLPNYGEFYDRRWFASGAGVRVVHRDPLLGEFPVDHAVVLDTGRVRFGVELCEDLWAPSPPGGNLALAGAELILNPSASNELVAKADYRRDLVRLSSAQRICGYLYASAGPGESTRDVVFGGHLLAAENGAVLGESARFEMDGSRLEVDFDLDALRRDRRANMTFASASRPDFVEQLQVGSGGSVATIGELRRRVDPQPFVPADEHEFDARAREILAIQSTGLARRLQAARSQRMIIGISGGLDSTLALLVCMECCERLDWARDQIVAVTMPGPATSAHTLESARQLAVETGSTLLEIPIVAAVQQHLADLGHDPDQHDVVFENAQARERTQVLFNLANQQGGIVVGTGDLSELALGWCTFNADHMANYNVNASVPKTLIAYLVRWYAQHRASPALRTLLLRVLDTPISPELIPGSGDSPAQKTEDIVGPYELHDFFMYHTLRYGRSPLHILALAEQAFTDRSADEIRAWLRVFLQRFFAQQFKRSTLPPGPKVGSVSLSPRGDWRMPDEASARLWLADLADSESRA